MAYGEHLLKSPLGFIKIPPPTPTGFGPSLTSSPTDKQPALNVKVTQGTYTEKEREVVQFKTRCHPSAIPCIGVRAGNTQRSSIIIKMRYLLDRERVLYSDYRDQKHRLIHYIKRYAQTFIWRRGNSAA